MAKETDPVDFLEREPDERLLEADLGQLPESVGPPPEPLPESAARRQVVRAGAMLTGMTLIGGSALTLVGIVELIADGGFLWLIVLVLGVIFVSTHWGWVHVAEMTGNRIEARRNVLLLDQQRDWLRGIEPYPRWEVSTSAGEDGSITVLTLCHRPVASREGKYTFVREQVAREVHPPEEPAAEVADRAESLRRQAAAQTLSARECYDIARDAYERTLLERDDEQQRLSALRAASEALSERINANLREPPLME